MSEAQGVDPAKMPAWSAIAKEPPFSAADEKPAYVNLRIHHRKFGRDDSELCLAKDAKEPKVEP